jgi:hypothetical protein
MKLNLSLGCSKQLQRGLRGPVSPLVKTTKDENVKSGQNFRDIYKPMVLVHSILTSKEDFGLP